ncbi:MarR family winged helix-turn-helix transcriptional regulator [Nocardia carnea]|uniref:MarR family winged helix-turn-helix transcriptional regulator n=1 Tax=Nocardia carnea TaxID=37328 RepID=UPI0024587C1A|nr:MarR family transcriptional regulator [Nocardia carnea]
MTSGKPRSETLNSLQLALRLQATRTVLFHSAVAHRAGIAVTDLSCLNLLSMDGPQTPGELAQHVGITRGGAVTAMIDRLERSGYVARRRDPDDRRRVLVEITAKAAQQVSPLFAGLGRAIEEQLEGRDAESLAVLLDFVTTSTDALTRATDSLRGFSA